MGTIKYIYYFGKDSQGTVVSEGDRTQKNLLGGKGANLAEMAKLGLPVPSGFTLSTEVCRYYYENKKAYPDTLKSLVAENLNKIESSRNKKFGCEKNPLLVSVRSGAQVSMPGMMDTILNLGLNDKTVEGLADQSGNARFAYDSYRRFIQMFSNVVFNVHSSRFDFILEKLKEFKNVEEDSQLSADDLKALIEKYKEIFLNETGKNFPQDTQEQLWQAIGAVFESWDSPRAIHYRRMENIPDHWGTAVNVQSMVFGNLGETSATGVAFTRHPATGEKVFFGEYLNNAQGEDVVSGIRTPQPLSQNQISEDSLSKLNSMEKTNPKMYQELFDIQKKLELHYKDMQDIEFTIEDNKLYFLQTRTGKRTARAAIKIAIDMVNEKLIDQKEAILRVDPYSLDQLLHPKLNAGPQDKVIAKGLPASPGAVCGNIVFTPEKAVELKNDGKQCILVRHETSPEDVQGMDASVGILTALGGMTSHAAVVARGMGKCCVAGCASLKIDYSKKTLNITHPEGNLSFKEMDLLTLDGNTGNVYSGKVATTHSSQDEYFTTLLSWADKYKKLGVRCNADTPTDALTARKFGAEGIGLCRTEHMFFESDRINLVRQMILSESSDQRSDALDQIQPIQENDFYELLQAMEGLPVTIRLLDPPLHEFLPHSAKDIQALSIKLKISSDKLMQKANSLKEQNPMLGHRGCRLAISFPEIYSMQVNAIIGAMNKIWTDKKIKPETEIMIPLVMHQNELATLRELCEGIIKATLAPELHDFIRIGTMLELPRACLLADKLAESADFFSFGTNDLTQTTMGLSRDDSGRFLPEYVDRNIFSTDPFASIDQDGVGQLVKIAVDKTKGLKNKKIKMGVCGEHGGDPRSIAFFHKIGLDYVSCSPYRVPAARLAAAQNEINSNS